MLIHIWNDNTTNPTRTININGQYICNALIDACVVSDTINISMNGLSPNLGADTVICDGGILKLTAGAGYDSVKWSNMSINDSILVFQTGDYWIEVFSQGCSKRDTISVMFDSPQTLNLGEDTILCNASLTLSVPNIYNDYLWSDNSTSFTTTINNTGNYWLRVNETTCPVFDTIFVQINNIVSPNLGNDTTICEENLLIGVPDVYDAYSWNTREISPAILISTSGDYWIEVEKNGCLLSDSISVIVDSLLGLTAIKDTVAQCGEVLLFTIDSSYSVLWNDGDTNKIKTINTVGNYNVRVSSKANSSCFNYSEFNVTYDCSIFIPNSFSPNGDGMNDKFEIYGEKNFDVFKLVIFDRWGIEIIAFSDPNFSWDGKIKGKSIPIGAYAWKEIYSKLDNGIKDNIILRGHLTLIK